MSSCKILHYLLITALYFGISFSLSAQKITDPEAEYNRIRAVAFNGQYSEASAAARNLLKEYPEYGDARILLGRILGWDKQYAEAAAVIDTLLSAEPDNTDAMKARLDIALWSGDDLFAERLASSILAANPSDSETRERLIKALLTEGRREEALAHSDTLLKFNPDNSFAVSIRELQFDTKKSDNLRLTYSFDSYTTPYKRYWQQVSFGGGHRFKWGMAGAGVNVGNINIGNPVSVSATEAQFEIEASPNITSKNYAYITYAHSPGRYYPRHRASLEVWQTLPLGWAASAGVNYYHFDRDIFIAGFSVEKYAGRYWLSGKTYFYFKDIGVTTSFYLNVRRYFNDTDFLQVTLGAGTAPDEPFDIQTDLSRLSAYSGRATYYKLLSKRIGLRINAGYSREEYADNVFRDRIDGAAGVIYLLNSRK